MPFKEPHELYTLWNSMKQRCTNPNARAWDKYGARGIDVCARWKVFADFVSDMGERPEGYTLDRIDNNKGYYPENCRWADRKTQQRNRNIRVDVIVDGVSYRAIELADQAGVKTDTIIDRAKRGLPLEQVLSPVPLRPDYASYMPAVAAKSAATRKSKTVCGNGHPINEANTYTTEQGWRRCRVCRNARLALQRGSGGA